MSDVYPHFPPNAAEFCALFPRARVCRFVNRVTGTLLNVRPSLDVVNDDVPNVGCTPEPNGVQYWLITPYGDGHAIVPIPSDGSNKVRYLTPSNPYWEFPVTVSPFPASWNILPTNNGPKVSPTHTFTNPPGLYEQWTCVISWPHFGDRDTGGRVLDYYNAGLDLTRDYTVTWPLDFSRTWQYWRIQFLHLRTGDQDIPPILPDPPLPEPEQ